MGTPHSLVELAEVNNELVRLCYLRHLAENPARRGGLTQREFTARGLFDESERRPSVRAALLEGLEIVDDHRADFDTEAVTRLLVALYEAPLVGCPFRITTERITQANGAVFRIQRDWIVRPQKPNHEFLKEILWA